MPWIDDQEQQSFLARQIGLDAIETDDPTSFKEKLIAAYRTENTIGSFFSQEKGLPDTAKATDYDPWEDFSDEEKLDEAFLERAMYADNPAEVDSLRKQVERERKDRGTLSEGGFLATLPVAVADPINLIPVSGAAYKTYRAGDSILKSAAVTASAGAMGASAAEVALQYSQVERSFGESATNIGMGAFFGGVLGGLPPTIRGMLNKEDFEMTMNPEVRLAAGENPVFADGSLSAAAVDSDPQVRGKFAKKLLKVMPFDPLSRTIVSDFKSTRQAVNRLAENFIDMDNPSGQSVETNIKLYDGMLYKALNEKQKVFADYKNNGGKLNRREFNEAVGYAMRHGSEDKHIKQAAEAFRREVYDPVKNKAIEVNLLPEDVSVETAENYLNRVWNKEKLSRNLPVFVDRVSKWLVGKDEARKAQRLDEIEQNFDVKIKEQVRVKETGEVIEMDVDANTAWRRATKRRGMADRLRDCLNA